MKKEFNILQYKGYENFKCIGSECRHTCCKDWDINIDNDTYKKYKISSYFTDEMLKKVFTKRKDGIIKFRLNENKNCPLQSESGLCDIQSNLGANFLCKTCRLYPRQSNIIDESLEKFLTTSCPAVCDMFLLNDEVMSFDSKISVEDTEDLAIKHKIYTKGDTYLKYFWDIRIFTISLLQNRELDIEKRLIILGVVYKRLDEVIKERSLDKIPQIIELYISSLSDLSLFGSLDDIKVNEKFKSAVLKILSFGKITDGLKELNIKLDEILLDSENDMYNELIENKYKKYLDKYSYTIENYLVNIAYSSAMPFSKNKNILESYLYLAVQYAMIKTYLICVENEEITTQDFSDVVTITSRTLNHNSDYEKDVIKFMNDISSGNLNMLAKIVTLIK